jgi:hypothetical protein
VVGEGRATSVSAQLERKNVGVKTMRSLILLHVRNKAYKYKNISQIHGHLSVANFVRGVLKHTYSSARA